MSFGRNPFVAKATAAEQKAQQAGDDSARQSAWREAARLWDRAAEREMDAKRRGTYEQNATNARASADEAPAAGAPADGDEEGGASVPPGATLLN